MLAIMNLAKIYVICPMDQSPSWEANSSSASQEILHIL